MNTIRISRAFCPYCLNQCFFEYNEQTGITSHVEDFTTRRMQLDSTGYIYAGHKMGVFTWHQRNTQLTALPLEWQMAAEHQAAIEWARELQNQDW